MVMKRSALGRGLDALITMDDLKTGGSSSISEIELSKIQPNPDQPRSVFEEEKRLRNWQLPSVHWVSFSRLR